MLEVDEVENDLVNEEDSTLAKLPRSNPDEEDKDHWPVRLAAEDLMAAFSVNGWFWLNLIRFVGMVTEVAGLSVNFESTKLTVTDFESNLPSLAETLMWKE